MSGPLEGIRVVEFAGIGPAPFCAMMLADHGAEVIHIDRFGSSVLIADPKAEILNRSRKSVKVDLKDPAGVSFVRKLCGSADAVIEGFRPGVMERLGLGPDVLIGDNPKLVYGRMTGWGQDGPYAAMAGHDINYIALSGALHATGRRGERPTPPLNLVGDFGGGGMMLAFGVLAAILSARATSHGQVVDAAMTEGSALLMGMMFSRYADGTWTDERGGNVLDSGAHFYDSYETADGKYVAIGPVEPVFYRKFLELVGLGNDEQFRQQHDRSQWPQLKARLDAHMKTRTRAEWCELLEGTDACFAPVMALHEVAQNRHNKARAAFVDVGGVMQPAPAPRFSRTASGTPVPLADDAAQTARLMQSLGYSDGEIAALTERKVIG